MTLVRISAKKVAHINQDYIKWLDKYVIVCASKGMTGDTFVSIILLLSVNPMKRTKQRVSPSFNTLTSPASNLFVLIEDLGLRQKIYTLI